MLPFVVGTGFAGNRAWWSVFYSSTLVNCSLGTIRLRSAFNPLLSSTPVLSLWNCCMKAISHLRCVCDDLGHSNLQQQWLFSGTRYALNWYSGYCIALKQRKAKMCFDVSKMFKIIVCCADNLSQFQYQLGQGQPKSLDIKTLCRSTAELSYCINILLLSTKAVSELL